MTGILPYFRPFACLDFAIPYSLGQSISLDTKHILAWVKEKKPKAYLPNGRYDKQRQPKGDPDCRLGCKRRSNQHKSSAEQPATPHKEGIPGSQPVQQGEYYWGYASGVIACKAPGRGEFVLAERTQPFDRSDVSYFLPLMAAVEQRMGRKTRFGAFDAWYVYAYFHCARLRQPRTLARRF